MKELSGALNFSLKIVSRMDEYGTWNPNENTWSGAIGEIYAGRADISISDFSMTSARLYVVDFTFPLIISKNCVFIKEPTKFAIKWSSYFQVSERTNIYTSAKIVLSLPIDYIFLSCRSRSNTINVRTQIIFFAFSFFFSFSTLSPSIQTFSHSVWIAMFGVLVFATIVLVLIKMKIGTDRNIGELLSDNFLEIWGIFCQQGLAGIIRSVLPFFFF